MFWKGQQAEFTSDQFIDLSPDPKKTKALFQEVGPYLPIPYECRGIFLVASIIQQVIPLLQEVDSKSHFSQASTSMLQWSDFLHEVKEWHPWGNEPLLTQVQFDRYEDEGELFSYRSVPLNDAPEEYFLWGVLWQDSNLLDSNEIRERLYLLLSLFVLIKWVLRTYPAGQELSTQLEGSLRKAFNLLVNITLYPTSEVLTLIDQSVTEFNLPLLVEQLENCRLATDSYDEGCYQLSLLIRFIIVEEIFHRPVENEEEDSPEYEVLLSTQDENLYSVRGLFDEDVQDAPSVVLQGPGSLWSEVLLSSGVSPAEFYGVKEVRVPIRAVSHAFSRSDQDSTPNIPPGYLFHNLYVTHTQNQSTIYEEASSLYIAGRNRARQLDAGVQLFTTRLSRIPLPELAKLLVTLDQLYQQRSSSDLSETLRLLMISIITGTPVSELINMQNVATPQSFMQQNQNTIIGYVSSDKCFIKRYFPPDRLPLSSAQKSGTIPVEQYVLIRDYFCVGSNLNNSVHAYFNQQESYYWIVYRRDIKPRLKAAGIDDKWIKPERLHNLLYSYLLGVEEGNQLQISALFGQKHKSDEVARFYTALKKDYLDQLLSKIFEELSADLQQNQCMPTHGLFCLRKLIINSPPSAGEWWRGDESLSQTPTPFTGYVGDEGVPTIDTLRKIIDQMKSSLDPAQAHLITVEKYHNIFTAYTSLVLGLVTGFRSVRTPILDLSIIDEESGFISLQEKDRKDRSHARVAFVPFTVIDQINAYLIHLRQRVIALPFQHQGVIVAEATKIRDKSVSDQDHYSIMMNRNFFFYLNKNEERYEELTGKHLKREVEKLVPNGWATGNANRHFLRTYLVNRDVAPTVINALMGHWRYGEESWDNHAAMDPWLYRAELMPHLEGVLEDVGFEVVGATLH